LDCFVFWRTVLCICVGQIIWHPFKLFVSLVAEIVFHQISATRVKFPLHAMSLPAQVHKTEKTPSVPPVIGVSIDKNATETGTYSLCGLARQVSRYA